MNFCENCLMLFIVRRSWQNGFVSEKLLLKLLSCFNHSSKRSFAYDGRSSVCHVFNGSDEGDEVGAGVRVHGEGLETSCCSLIRRIA